MQVLIADDDANNLFVLKECLEQEGYDIITANDGEEALDLLRTHPVDIAILDLMMPKKTGYEVIELARQEENLKYIPMVLLTARHSLDDLIKGFEIGADEYIKKPFQKDELLARLRAILRIRELYKDLYQERATVSDLKRFHSYNEGEGLLYLIGTAECMQDLYASIRKVATTDLPVLITGESGVGKELVARAIHDLSSRNSKPFIAQNCSVFNEHILESELFGHAKGAFTGAISHKKGLFEAADGGTLFLDEIGEMQLPLQAKLLRVLQDGTFIPVGEVKEKRVNVRVVAATNRDLKELVREGKFREDLYYRICVVELKVPPLRDRKEDIPLLVRKFVEETGKRVSVKREVMEILRSYDWPGNVRQLKNEIRKLVAFSEAGAELDISNLSEDILSKTSSSNVSYISDTRDSHNLNLKRAISNVERELISRAIKQCKGNKSKAAKLLGISRSNLISKISHYGLED